MGLRLGFLRFQDVCSNIGSRKPVAHINHKPSQWHHLARNTMKNYECLVCLKCFRRMVMIRCIFFVHVCFLLFINTDFFSRVKNIWILCRTAFRVNKQKHPYYSAPLQTRRMFRKITERSLDTGLLELTIGRESFALYLAVMCVNMM